MILQEKQSKIYLRRQTMYKGIENYLDDFVDAGIKSVIHYFEVREKENITDIPTD